MNRPAWFRRMLRWHDACSTLLRLHLERQPFATQDCDCALCHELIVHPVVLPCAHVYLDEDRADRVGCFAVLGCGASVEFQQFVATPLDSLATICVGQVMISGCQRRVFGIPQMY